MGNRLWKLLPSSAKIFIDSNIFVYHLSSDPVYGISCKNLLKKVEDGDLHGYTSTIVVTEVVFAYIRLWLIKQEGIEPKGILQFLKRTPQILSKIELEIVQELFTIVDILRVGKGDVKEAFKYISQFHLLPNDATNLSVMERAGLTHIVTQDEDYEKVGTVIRWKVG
jgi:predicted nucleic acid-binding protein